MHWGLAGFGAGQYLPTSARSGASQGASHACTQDLFCPHPGGCRAVSEAASAGSLAATDTDKSQTTTGK